MGVQIFFLSLEVGMLVVASTLGTSFSNPKKILNQEVAKVVSAYLERNDLGERRSVIIK